MKLRYAALALVAALFTGSQAKAGWGLGYGGCGFAGYGYGAYALGHIPTPPYFSLHPPVYYGHTIHRTYGRSPFARGPVSSYVTGYRQASQASYRLPPQMVINPYMENSDSDVTHASPGDRPQPQMIVNPFYQPGQPDPGAEQVARK